MGTTAQKLAKLKETKADIKQSIIEKGVTVPADATFASYPYYIDQISTGITPTGNIELTQQTGTNVSAYATASVRSSALSLKTPTIDTATGLVTSKATLTTSGWVGSAPTDTTLQLTTQGAKTITPSSATQTAVGMGVYTTGIVLVDPMPSGTAGTPVAEKGTVSNNQITITPKVTNTAGYISGGTVTGTGVTVTASELVSGTTETTAGTSAKTVSVTNYANITVKPTPSEVKNATSAGTITPTQGKLLSKVTVPAGTAGTPVVEKGTVSNHQITVTPKVTNSIGWISTATLTGTGVTVTASELVSGTTSTTAGTSPQTVDVINYASVTVNPTPSETKTASASGDITPSSGKLLSKVTVPAGTAGTPVATKGSVSNHQITITPKVTNTAGWVTGQTITGTDVTVSASELVSGTTAVTAGTSTATVSVTNYASVTVNPTPSEVKTATVNGDVTPSSGKLLSKVTVAVSYNIYRTGSGDPSSSLGNDGDLYVDIS